MKRLPFYPLCAGLFALVSLYSTNIDETSPHELILPIGIVLGFSLVLLVLAALVLRNIHRAAIVVAALVFCFTTFGYWVEVLSNIYPHFQNHFAYRNIIATFQLAVLAAIGYWAVRRLKDPASVTASLNWIGCFLLAWPLAIIGWKFAHGGPPISAPAAVAPLIAKLTALPQPPDIYFIILDAHGRQDILREQYNYDDSTFLQKLRDKGFYVAGQSNSNYMWTILSTSSALNMRYLDDVTGNGSMSLRWRQAAKLLRYNMVAAELKSVGYQTVAVETQVSWLCFDNADRYFKITNRIGISGFQQLAMDTSALPLLGGNALKARLILDQYHLKREMMLYKLSIVKQLAALSGPKFVFLHIFEPHPPFVFAADGSDPAGRGYGPISDAPLTDQMHSEQITAEQYHDWYRAQITFTDNQVTTAIDTILNHSARPPVIVLIGDHGPRLRTRQNPDLAGLQECLSNLTAVYLPGKNNLELYPGITPVNLFRVVLNDYFNASLPLLKDRCYFSCTPDFYNVADVTGSLRSSGEPAAASQAAVKR